MVSILPYEAGLSDPEIFWFQLDSVVIMQLFTLFLFRLRYGASY